MHVHLVDGTYELFRAWFGAPASKSPAGMEVGATKSVMRSLWAMLREDIVTHVACSFDTTVESFRNEMFAGYKTGEGLEPELFAQFGLVERALRAMGLVVWSMIEFEADDGLATGAVRYADDPRVDRVVICTPDKDLTQMVRGERVVCFDRRKRELFDAAGVERKFGVRPTSIPDYLALVGDAADGVPGIPRWGAKSTAAVLTHYEHLEAIPDDAAAWAVTVRGAKALAANLAASREAALLYRSLTTLRTDVPLEESLDDLKWTGVDADALRAVCAEIGFDRFAAEVLS